MLIFTLQFFGERYYVTFALCNRNSVSRLSVTCLCYLYSLTEQQKCNRQINVYKPQVGLWD